MPLRKPTGPLAAENPYLVKSERFIVLFKAEGRYRKLFSVQFERRDNGLGYMVHLPYFAHTKALLGNYAIEAGSGPKRENLRDRSTTTTKRLKYSHHPDGAAQFSQDGQVYTSVRAKTPPLDDYQGHLFTVNFWGVEAFEFAKSEDLRPPRLDRTGVRFTPEDESLPASQYAGRIIGTRYTVPPQGIIVDPKAASRGPIVEPIVYKRWDGSRSHGIPIFPTHHQADEYSITLTYLPEERSTGHGDPSLTLSGGFDFPQGPEGPLTYILAFYTDRDPEDWEAIVAERGTIDLPPEVREAAKLKQ